MSAARLGELPGVAGLLAQMKAQLQDRAERPPELSSAVLAARNGLILTGHGLDRVRERIFDGIECQDPEPWRAVFGLWDDGRKTPWHDPDDRPGCVTVTSIGARGSLVGRREVGTGCVWIVSALTLQQHTNNARFRWRRAEDRFLR
jgi:hypothetical protein